MMQVAEQLPPEVQLDHRYEALLKVTGKLKYCAEFTQPFPQKDLLYAFVVQSTIPSGTIVSMDAHPAELCPGVIAVLTPFNAPKLPTVAPQPPATRRLSLLQDKQVFYNGEPIALVVARTLDQARYAAGQLKIQYAPTPAKLNFLDRLAEARPPKRGGKAAANQSRGELAPSLTQASVTVDETYITPIQNHNPMEPHATIAWWSPDGEKLTVYDTTQYITGDKMSIAKALNLPLDNVHVICPFVGGGFGCKGSMWSHVPLAAMASKITQKPVKLVLDRPQMFGPVGARPSTVNHIVLSASADGKLQAIQHDEIDHASVMEDFAEHATNPSRILYQSAANRTSLSMVDMNLGVATFMRAPGESPGTAVLEIAMDELAEKLNLDPVQLRLINYAERDPSEDKPWSSKHLRECYTQAADRFGWSKRQPAGSRLEGNHYIGFGMATATYPANRSAAAAIVRLNPDGTAYAASGTQDLGTGMYTVLAQTAARFLGLKPTQITVQCGDSTLPKAPVSGGSQSTASVLPAVEDAARQVKLKLIEIAINDPQSPLHGLNGTDIDLQAGNILQKSHPNRAEPLTALLARNGNKPVEAMGSAEPGEDKSSMSTHSFGAVFAEVAVDKDTHMVKVRRVVATYDIGTLMNDKTGINQMHGGIVWSVGTALQEQTVIDNTYGRAVNNNLAEYHVPINADIGTVDVTVLNIPDTKFNPLGARGIGEIGNTGTAAAIANAIYNATGKRVRSYPITPDKLMSA
jgi:xanthine dehydrogenase YagR molybdenum-binding subunit